MRLNDGSVKEPRVPEFWGWCQRASQLEQSMPMPAVTNPWGNLSRHKPLMLKIGGLTLVPSHSLISMQRMIGCGPI